MPSSCVFASTSCVFVSASCRRATTPYCEIVFGGAATALSSNESSEGDWSKTMKYQHTEPGRVFGSRRTGVSSFSESSLAMLSASSDVLCFGGPARILMITAPTSKGKNIEMRRVRASMGGISNMVRAQADRFVDVALAV